MYWGVPHVWTYGISVQAMNWNGVKEKKKRKIEKQTARIADNVVKKTAKAGLKTKAVFMLMRMLQKADLASGEPDKAYWEKNGWLGKDRPWR